MQTVKPITTLTNLLTKNNFEVKEVQKNKYIVAFKKGYPRLYFEVLRKGVSVKNTKQLNDSVLMNANNVLEFINELNKQTIMSKYYLQSESVISIEAMIFQPMNEQDFGYILNILKHDMKQILLSNRNSRKYLAT